MNYSKNSKSGMVDQPNNHKIPIGAIVYFKYEIPDKQKLDEFREKVGQMESADKSIPIEIIDSIFYNGGQIMSELSGELFWYGWCNIEYDHPDSLVDN